MFDRNNIECCWDEFCDWMEDEGRETPRAVAHSEGWMPWFRCWCAALDAVEQMEESDV